VVVHTDIPALGRLRQEDHEFQVSLGYMRKPWLREKKNNSNNIRN
jgi:hypothetical protein